MNRLLKIFEVMWLVASGIALYMAISRAIAGEAFGNYIYITLFTACVAVFMYNYKKKHRKYMEKYHQEKQSQLSEASKKNQENKA